MIDFHTHIFPEKIAGKTISFLAEISHTDPFLKADEADLRRSVKEAGLEASVILPVVTKPSQFESINQFASHFTEGELISFGGIHPGNENYKECLKTIKGYGLKGIKLHPDYQQTDFNDIRYKRIVDYASELGLIISVHAGVDIGYPDPVHCTPKMSREVIDEVKPEKLVLAHMGGNNMWEEVEELLVGQNVMFDTAFCFGNIPDEQFLSIVKNHGADKILFATDSPWAPQSEYARYLNDLPMSEQEKNLIGSENAKKLLKLEKSC